MTIKNDPTAEVRIALMTLTRLPAGRVADPAPPMSSTRWAYPLVGAAVGLIAGGAYLASVALGIPALVAAFLAVLASVLVTGALHEDGLADCADGFWGGRDRRRKLEIMRDSRIGTYGTLALVFSVGVRVAAVASLSMPFWTILGVAILSRFAMVAAIDWMTPARDDGLGASVAEGSGQLARGAVIALAGVLVLVVALGPGALVAIVAMSVAGLAFARLATRHIGGQTGDVLGGLQQVTEIVGLVALSAIAT